MREEEQMPKEKKEYIEKVAKGLPKKNPTDVKIVKVITSKVEPSGTLMITRGEIFGKDAENPEWIEEVQLKDKTFYIMSKAMMEKLSRR